MSFEKFFVRPFVKTSNKALNASPIITWILLRKAKNNKAKFSKGRKAHKVEEVIRPKIWPIYKWVRVNKMRPIKLKFGQFLNIQPYFF